MKNPRRVLVVTLVLVAAATTPVALQVIPSPPMPPYTPTKACTETMQPSPTCPAACEETVLPPQRCPTCTPLPTPAGTAYPPPLTITPRPRWSIYLEIVRRHR